MPQAQLKIDFSSPKITLEDEKKTALIAFKVGEKFEHDLKAMAERRGCDPPELYREYLLKGYLSDYKDQLLLEFNSNKTLQELMAK